ncbi:ATP-grasp domain-containing protein [Endozoicomonas numazuensis]|uniref:hypothetical protein n=1 Tax=Endozoicomonas numazuensis TaxID=1137799 RepID=UPI0006891EEF|nr:hypothetical protein [Endozoicomonas numazuensis]
MIIRSLLVLGFIWQALKQRVKPWQFFQLNADYFNDDKGLYSKLDMDQSIPRRWRLKQYLDTDDIRPEHYPVFLKPEWGQNSAGVIRIDNEIQLEAARANRSQESVPYLIQESAQEKREFEVFVIRSLDSTNGFKTLSVTQVMNTSNDSHPVNGIYNRETFYLDKTSELSKEQMDTLGGHLSQAGNFRIARYGIRADNIEALAQGTFKIFEVNLFLPMPLVLLSKNLGTLEKLKWVVGLTRQLAEVTGEIPSTQKRKSIFFRKLLVLNRLNLKKLSAKPEEEMVL